MRIAFVTETWLPSTDGIVTRLLATVSELRERGHDVLVIAPADGPAEFPGPAVETVPTVGAKFLYGGKRWGLPLPRVARFLRAFEPDVVHLVNPAFLGVAGLIAAHRQGRPVVASYHTDIARYARHYRLGGAVPLIWTVLRSLHRRAELNLATSDAAITELTAHGIPGVRLWPRGVDLVRFRPAPARRTTGRPIALYVGRLAAEKGLHRLASLAEPAGGFRLVLAGTGPARAHLERTLPPDTVFTGLLHGEDLAEAYRAADLFVFPSTTDTLGLVLLEALASGLPVLAAESPAARSTLAGTTAARFFPVDEPVDLPACARALLAGDHRAEARRHAAQSGWDTATDGLLDLYAETLASQRSKPLPYQSSPVRTPGKVK
ncbi:glycosyltransferase family 1 protein [Amycolatopsis rhabdoformis]|uniref:Glycosyltransferase family 1 protein n=1 Tax=Amycolatopsis rhabdoformis TaxID=1448059 RepID=A0ABZ1IIT1_9PSEU|nr:glycosyltransferase family 1 protein [Amycolatopsis rhabdoformis]WSE33638.1 glycosyltransferase family 1 protein [Amycolatopsis rhabdoformis]